MTVEECPDLRWIKASSLLQADLSSDRHHGAWQDLGWEGKQGSSAELKEITRTNCQGDGHWRCALPYAFGSEGEIVSNFHERHISR